MGKLVRVRKVGGSSNKIAGQDYNSHSFYFPKNAETLEGMVKDTFEYFIKEINYHKALLNIYKDSVVDCFYKVPVETRTEISKKIMKREKEIQSRYYKLKSILAIDSLALFEIFIR